jgi:hypothetical protein
VERGGEAEDVSFHKVHGQTVQRLSNLFSVRADNYGDLGNACRDDTLATIPDGRSQGEGFVSAAPFSSKSLLHVVQFLNRPTLKLFAELKISLQLKA